MNTKILFFLGVVCAFLILMLSYTIKRINTLEEEKNQLKIEVCKKEQAIKEKEKQNEILRKAEKENAKFKEELNNDNSDNINVVPASYILERLRKD